MALNGYLPREGDIIVIHAKVKFDVEASEDRVHCRPLGSFHDASVPLDKVVDVHCRHWKEGQKVILAEDGYDRVGEVLSVFDEAVWVKFDHGSPQTIPANDLKPAPEETQP